MPEQPPTQPKLHKTVLDNGLTVLIRESHRVPVATFWVWYRVGARNEVPGITGISHWVEHMLFKGTPRWNVGEIFRTVNKHGGQLNGFTWLDYTAYFETLPSSAIMLGPDIESDRMSNAVFDPAAVNSERTVILSERAGNENHPTFYLREEVNGAAFRAHPYGQGVIGFRSDLEQMTRDDLYGYYQRYYHPGNATVVVVGDVDPDNILSEVTSRFGGIAPGPIAPGVRTVEPVQQGQRRVTVRRPAPAPTLLAAWHAPAAMSPDAVPMIVLDTVLSGGKSVGFGGGGSGRSSRLYRALVAAGLASAAGSSFSLTIDPYLFSASATLVPAARPQAVEEIVFREVARLREEPVPAGELARAIKQLRAQFAYMGESVSSQAYWIGSLATVAPERDPDEIISQIEAVTPEEIMRVARQYLVERESTVGWLEPLGPAAAAAIAERAAALPVQPCFFDPAPPTPRSVGPALDLKERQLANGLKLVGYHDPTSRAVVIDIRIPAGSVRDGAFPGIASFTGKMLTRGTSELTFAQLNEELDSLGAAINVGVGREYTDVTGKALQEDAGRLAQLMADVILRPTFPEDEATRVAEQSLTALKQLLDSAGAVADETLRELIFPVGHPYRQRSIGTEESLRAITPTELRAFHAANYHPNDVIVATAGGLPVDEATRLLERAFQDWQPVEKEETTSVQPVPPPEQTTRAERGLEGKSQAEIALGLPTIPRSSPDYDALRVANLILGRLGLMGRLGESVREKQGMAYHVSSSLSAGREIGLWTAHAGVDPSNVDRAIASILAEVEKLRREGVTAQELDDAKSYLVGSLPLGLESSDAIAGTILDLIYYGLGLDYIERLPDRIKTLTAEELRAAAQRYILPDRLAIAVSLPAAAD
ncbi:MAG TPA: pitrilysin family protein [Thermomicrobiaceae bacterium]|nr:pitrilysin family protein [Thermomicrobiaceae bacterium]